MCNIDSGEVGRVFYIQQLIILHLISHIAISFNTSNINTDRAFSDVGTTIAISRTVQYYRPSFTAGAGALDDELRYIEINLFN